MTCHSLDVGRALSVAAHIGTCAWSFDEWHGVFYPGHLPGNERLGNFRKFRKLARHHVGDDTQPLA